MIPKKIRPIGITLIACVFLWIGCLGTVFFPIIAIFGGTSILWRSIAGGVIHSEFWLKLTSYLFSSIWYLFYVAYAFIGFGLWKLKNWARNAVLALAVLGASGSVVAIKVFGKNWDFALTTAFAAALPFAWIAFYLKRPRVRFAFEPWQSTPDSRSVVAYPPGLSRMGKVYVVAGVLATVGLFVGGLMFTVENSIHSSEIYQASLKEAESSPCVTAAIGSPLTPGWGTSGSTTESSENGTAELSIPVHGPKGKGDLNLEGEKQRGVWRIKSLILVHGSEQIPIEPPGPAGTCH